ncbi:MAG: hypothetical protein ACR2RF_25395 [Geminicoccaceae bacterium]
MSDIDKLVKQLRKRSDESGITNQAADALERLQAELAEARAQDVEAARSANLPDGYQWGDDAMEQFNFGKERAAQAIEALAAPAPEPTNVYLNCTSCEWSEKYGQTDRSECPQCGSAIYKALRLEPTTSEAEQPCEIRWCKSGIPATRDATDCHDDGAWRVSICQQCFDILGLDRDGADLPSDTKERLAAQQQGEGNG